MGHTFRAFWHRCFYSLCRRRAPYDGTNKGGGKVGKTTLSIEDVLKITDSESVMSGIVTSA
jgi:hypothetical protein